MTVVFHILCLSSDNLSNDPVMLVVHTVFSLYNLNVEILAFRGIYANKL